VPRLVTLELRWLKVELRLLMIGSSAGVASAIEEGPRGDLGSR
jgi:hypothetical protein